MRCTWNNAVKKVTASRIQRLYNYDLNFCARFAAILQPSRLNEQAREQILGIIITFFQFWSQIRTEFTKLLVKQYTNFSAIFIYVGGT